VKDWILGIVNFNFILEIEEILILKCQSVWIINIKIIINIFNNNNNNNNKNILKIHYSPINITF